jgi:hypothetical protein
MIIGNRKKGREKGFGFVNFNAGVFVVWYLSRLLPMNLVLILTKWKSDFALLENIW